MRVEFPTSHISTCTQNLIKCFAGVSHYYSHFCMVTYCRLNWHRATFTEFTSQRWYLPSFRAWAFYGSEIDNWFLFWKWNSFVLNIKQSLIQHNTESVFTADTLRCDVLKRSSDLHTVVSRVIRDFPISMRYAYKSKKVPYLNTVLVTP